MERKSEGSREMETDGGESVRKEQSAGETRTDSQASGEMVVARVDPLEAKLSTSQNGAANVSMDSAAEIGDGTGGSRNGEEVKGEEGVMEEAEVEKKDEEGKEKQEATETQDEAESGKPSTDAVYRELSLLNGRINKMPIFKIKNRLRALHLDCNGKREVLKKRLKSYYRYEKLDECAGEGGGGGKEGGGGGGGGKKKERNREKNRYYDYFVVIDYEATCDNTNTHSYRHEIIEFPAVLVCTRKLKTIAEFHSFVRPVINPRLTEFCTNLTAITQDKVNFAPEFPEVLEKFEVWLSERGLVGGSASSFAVVTDGPWDMGRFLYQQCKISNLAYPGWAKNWINLRKNYSNFYNTRRMCLNDMLTQMGLKFEGQPHSGRDDSRNIARVAIRLSRDGSNMRVNEAIILSENCHRTVRNITRQNFAGMKRKLQSEQKGQEEEEGGGDKEEVAEEEEEEESKPIVDMSDREEFPELGSKS